MNVLERVQIVFKMQVSILHTAFDTLCCLLLHGVSVLGHVVAQLTRAEESVALWTQYNKLLHRHRIQLFLGESDCLAIHSAIEGMVDGVLTEIISVRVAIVHCIGVRQSVIGFLLQKFGLANRLRKIPASVISPTCTLFLKFSCVFPKTLLFINLKKSFRKLLPANERCWVLKSIYVFNQVDCLNVNTPCIRVTTRPNSRYSFRLR